MLFWDNFIGLHRGDFSPREVKDIVKREMASCVATNMEKFLNKRGGESIFYWLQGPKKKMKVRTLKKFCNTFNIDFDELERKGIILGPIIILWICIP